MDDQGGTTDEDVRDHGETMDGDIRDQITREDILEGNRCVASGRAPRFRHLRLSTISYWKTGADTPRRPLLVYFRPAGSLTQARQTGVIIDP